MGTMTIIIGLFFLWLSFTRKNMLLSICTSLIWFAMLMWFFFAPAGTSLFGVNTDWFVYLAAVFLVVTFIPLLTLMDTEIRYESQTRNGRTSWTEFGSVPTLRKPSSYDTYKEELKKRLRR